VKKLWVRILPEMADVLPHMRQYVNQDGRVVGIDRQISGTPPFCYWATVKMGDGNTFYAPVDHMEPVGIHRVPRAHRTTRKAIRLWVFTTAMRDAWINLPPEDLEEYIKEWGEPWKDKRVYDVQRRR
jgi:hypothetical protein